MKLSEFDYHLPRELVAAHPPADRPSARLLKVDRTSGDFSHCIFRDLEHFLVPGDVLVLNNTKVLPARVFGNRATGGKVEILFLKNLGRDKWRVLLKPGGQVKKDSVLSLGSNGLRYDARVLDDATPACRERILGFEGADSMEILSKIGHMPLPPYIGRPDTPLDREHYQTVFAEKEGAVAAPTAGLHFNEEMLERLRKKGVEIKYVTLHTGYGTFQPLEHEEVEKNQLFEEEYEISAATADAVNLAKRENRRVIACGTTSVRALESSADEKGFLKAFRGSTCIFIYPPYDFKIISGLITNFHLPKSSLMLLVAAFLESRDKLMKVYDEAVNKRYNFYSYGDAMVVL